jgi:hypothetical protein
MSAWIHALPLGWMALLVFGATYAACVALYALAQALGRSQTGRQARTVNAALLSPLGVVFGLLVVFTGAQVWGDVDRARSTVFQEANALRTAVVLAGAFPDSSAARLRTLVARQIDQETTVEWPAMARGEASLGMIPPALAEALMVAAAVQPSRPGRVEAQRELVAALATALEARRLRILTSHAHVNGIKWAGILLQALCTLTAIALVHAENRRAATAGLGLFGTAVAICLLLLLAHDAPFTGSYSVRPAPLLEVRPH